MPRRDPWGFIALAAFFVLVVVALFGERVAPYETIYFVVEHGRDPRPYEPGLVYPLGSDVLGRDLVSVVLAGARTTILIVVAGGVARVALAGLLAVIGALSRRARSMIDAASELVAAVPATLVVLLVVLVFVRGETTFAIFIGALLLTGWAGPYRVLRVELDRLAHMAFTDSAHALGVSRPRIVARHHLPHLVPMLALNTSQQAVASLVALAELGVLGVFVGTTRMISIEESMSFVPAGQRNRALLADPPEWGGLLANGRDVETLWATRWVFLVPGVAIALLAVALAAIGVALARRYARRDVLADLHGRGAAALALSVALLIVASAVVPERYAAAREWASAARAAVSESRGDVRDALAGAGLEAVGDSHTVERDVAHVVRTGPASAKVGDSEVRETSDGELELMPVLFRDSGGGHVRAPLVFASWGIAPVDHRPQQLLGLLDLGTMIKDWPDDYAAVDAAGKVVVVLRAVRITSGTRTVTGPDPDASIQNALKRGPAAVVYVDPLLATYARSGMSPMANPYARLRSLGPVSPAAPGPPVLAVSVAIADRLLAPAGLRPSEIYASLQGNAVPGDGDYAKRSAARPLGVSGEIEVPVTVEQAHVRSVVGTVPGAPSDPSAIVVWAALPTPDAPRPGTIDVLIALARALADRRVPVIFVAFDPAIDPEGNARALGERLRDRRIAAVVVLDDLEGSRLRFSTPNGDLIPAFDLYAERAGARHAWTLVTGSTTIDGSLYPGVLPFVQLPRVLVTADGGGGDLRADAAATIGYLAGRIALGAAEWRR